MASMLDIARSGILAYRSALAVTAENVANVGTDGYRRRDVATQSVGGAQATPTTLPSGGQGVSVVEVRRAFDALVAERARATSGAQSAAEAHLAGAQAIERLMLPGDDGVDGSLRDFFDALTELSAKPADTTTRLLALRAGEGLADAVGGLAIGMETLRRDLLTEAQGVARTAQGLLDDLEQVSRRMGGLSIPGTGSVDSTHALADRRDALLDELARLLPVSVELAEDGRPSVRLGSASGPLLLERNTAGAVAVTGDDPLTLSVTPPGTDAAQEMRNLPNGRIGGLSRAIGALDMARQELDGFARTLASAMNDVHRAGVDQTGAPGGALFSLDGWQVRANPANGGAVQVAVEPQATPDARGEITLIRDGTAGLWRAFDAQGAELAAGQSRLVLPGAVVDLAGTAMDGDRIVLSPVSGLARDLRLALSDPRALAAAAAYAVQPDPANSGSGSIGVAPVPLPASGLGPVSAIVAAGPVDLLGGVLGMLPAGTTGAGLVSLGRPAQAELPFAPGASLLTITLDGTAHTLALPALADATALAGALSDGTLRDADGRSLSELGLTAEATVGGALRLMRPGGGQPPAANLTGPGLSVTAVTRPGAPPGGMVQVITRDGRHVAGAPLTAADAARLITVGNGFLPGAVYDPSPLTAGTETPYRGTGLSGITLPGLQAVRTGIPAAATGTALPLPANGARALALADAAGNGATVALPEGASAALAASRLNAALPGLSARGVTALELSGLPAGPVSFQLQGVNVPGLTVSATLAGDAAPLATAINAVTGSTGIRAELSPDGARILLVQPEGHDITLSGVALPPGETLTATPAAEDGTAGGAATLLGDTVTALRQGGQVLLTAAQGFSVTEGGTLLGSAADPAQGGAFARTTALAGAETRLRMAPIPGNAEGGVLHSLSVGGQSVAVAMPAGATGAQSAAALAAALRRDAPRAELVGAPMAAPPAEGAMMALTVDGAGYTLRIQNGQPVIEGPEADRLTARIDAANRLVIRAEGVTDGRGIGVAAAPGLGFATGQGTLTLTGATAAADPSALHLDIGGTGHAVQVAGGAVVLPAGFPGSAALTADGALQIALPVPGASLATGLSPAAGFGGPRASIRVEGDSLTITGATAALPVGLTTAGAFSQSLDLGSLPPEDLVVAMTGQGTLRLAGAVQDGPAPSGPGAVEIEITDATVGQITLRDALSGHAIASGVMDAAGRVTLGGLAIQIAGNPATGDRFALAPVAGGSADGGTALALAALRNVDPATGAVGMIERMTRLQSETGLRAAAADRSLATASAAREAAEREQAALGAVDLDAEAARMLELQQAYQASAQAMSVARTLFDTLMQML